MRARSSGASITTDRFEGDPPARCDTADRHTTLHQAIRVSQLSIAWNACAGLAGAVTGLAAGSLALVGFGLDALVDAAASGVLVHRFHSERKEPHRADALERRARGLIGLVLLVIGVYVAVSSVHALAVQHGPEKTTLGVAIALASVVVLPPLAVAKWRLAATLGSRALRADGALTAIAASLAAGALLGLILTRSLGWWWADSVIALGMVAILVREGAAVLRGRDL
jgi:divalent metal cation (Fe/Co/Zn/Cd) transporter